MLDSVLQTVKYLQTRYKMCFHILNFCIDQFYRWVPLFHKLIYCSDSKYMYIHCRFTGIRKSLWFTCTEMIEPPETNCRSATSGNKLLKNDSTALRKFS